MKRVFISAAVLATIAFAACNSGSQHEANADSSAAVATTPAATVTGDIKTTGAVNTIVDDYLKIKDALANDNDADAAAAGKALAAAVAAADKSGFTPEQQQIFAANEAELKEHGEHISQNTGNIEHQREHFAEMSEDVMELVKTFGGGRTLYKGHCPMYNNNKGADWLTTTSEVKNPYMGAKMLACGSVEELSK
ncbi:DUF3347 domain-containing protein [Chitinophaga solisilvae]|uniref:DUF3347 domain-containing protein n=1 Tax=Chitinophaga solisilvae TaxID=1233460 RepID=UPI0013694F23|nr:DUF3347 domain-containing protein [Chitinophaga solisilvae]